MKLFLPLCVSLCLLAQTAHAQEAAGALDAPEIRIPDPPSITVIEQPETVPADVGARYLALHTERRQLMAQARRHRVFLPMMFAAGGALATVASSVNAHDFGVGTSRYPALVVVATAGGITFVTGAIFYVRNVIRRRPYTLELRPINAELRAIETDRLRRSPPLVSIDATPLRGGAYGSLTLTF